MIVPIIMSPDTFSYNSKAYFYAENNHYLVEHRHDWSKATKKKRDEMLCIGDFFGHENDFSYLESWNKKTGELVFKTPVPALTFIFIDPDSSYIVGLSKIKFSNPHQLVIFDPSGKLILKKHIAAQEVRLTIQEYEEFKDRYPRLHQLYVNEERLTHVLNDVYIDIDRMYNEKNKIPKKLFRKFYVRYVPHRYSKNFGETSCNWILWYKEPDPQITCHFRDNKLIKISLLDNKGKFFEIPITTFQKSDWQSP